MPPPDDSREPAAGEAHAGHEHAGHEHADHDHTGHDHAGGEEQLEPGAGEPDLSDWAASATRAVCPACGAAGALSLGGGLFCPACGETSTNPGYGAPG